MKRLALFLWLAVAAPIWGQVPTIVQASSFPGTHGNTTSDYAAPMPAAVLSGNTVIVGVQAGAAPASVADNTGANTYTQAGTTCTDASQPISFWVAKNVTNGPRTFTPHWSSNTTFASMFVMELYNVDQTTPVDTVSAGINPTCNHAASGTAITAGSATPTTSGAIAINFTIQDSVATPLSGAFTNGSACNGFTTRLADIVGSIFIQTAITSGACNADATQPTSHAWNSSTLFLRPATAGTAPGTTAVRVVKEQHMSWVNGVCDASPLKVQWRGDSTLWGMRWVGAPNETLGLANGAASDPANSAGGTWTEVGTFTQNAASGVVQFWVCKSCTASSTNVITVPYANTCSQDSALDLMDIANADTSATYAEQHGTGNMLAGTILTTGTAITPSAVNGLVVSFDGHASNTTTAVTTGFFMSAIMTPTPGTSPVDENNMRMLYYNAASLLPVANIYTNSAAVGVWADKMVFIPAGSGGGGGGSGAGSMMMMGIGK